MDQGVLAVVRRFPSRHRAIEALAAQDLGFRSLCADLADAQAALRWWQESSSPVRNERQAEYSALISGLASEIEAALDRAVIVPLSTACPEAGRGHGKG